MSLKYGLLGLLNYGSLTGYELNKAFNASLGFFWQGQTSQIYRELVSMERSGWLVSERIVQKDKPNKKLYTITGEGKQALAEWLSDASGAITEALCVRNAFLMRLFFAGEMPPSHAISMLREFRGQCGLALETLGDTSRSIAEYSESVPDENKSRYWRIVAMFGDGYYRAELEWADKALSMLEGGG
ncbi:MAG: PadR family transcriptional regulator [Synergistaceae bacterium]|jgi:DNA-binding PadR family transcriptional regulator|nr:PadR family transcriptional regulator [Synergistaceae bacterium]